MMDALLTVPAIILIRHYIKEQYMKSAIALAAVLLVSGCATAAKFTTKMDGFIGQSEGAVIAAYGIPQGSYQLQDGSKVLQYTRSSNIVLPGATTMQPVTTNTKGNLTLNQGMLQSTGSYTQQSTTYVPTQAPATNIALACSVTFTVDSGGIVRQWNANGNHCVSR